MDNLRKVISDTIDSLFESLESKSHKGNRLFQMLMTAKFQHYDDPKGELSSLHGEEDRKRIASKLSKEDKKQYREWLKTPEGQESLEKFLQEQKTKESKNSFFKALIKLIVRNGELNIYALFKIKNWPKIPVTKEYGGDGKKLEPLDLENNEVASLDNKNLTVICGGDWQNPWVVDIGYKNGYLSVINYKEAEKGKYKSTKKMKKEEVLKKLFENHPMYKDFKILLSVIKNDLGEYIPWSNSYGEEQYEEKLVKGPELVSGGMGVCVIWQIGGHDKAVKTKTDGKSHEQFLQERFEKWAERKIWGMDNLEIIIDEIRYKIKVDAETTSNFEDTVKYSILLEKI